MIARVGNTGRATNDHLHLELRRLADRLDRRDRGLAAAVPAVHHQPRALAPSRCRAPASWRARCSTAPARRCRRRGSTAWPSATPIETPFSYAETYGDKAHGHPLYGEHFARERRAGGQYVLGTEIDGTKVYRRVTVEAGKLTWVVFQP